MKRYLFIVLAGCCLTAGCRKIELVNPTEYEVLPFGEDPDADPIGMYLLNEGNMGSNKADIDYLDYRTAVYARGIYAEKTPMSSRNWATWATTSRFTTDGCSPSSIVRTRSR